MPIYFLVDHPINKHFLTFFPFLIFPLPDPQISLLIFLLENICQGFFLGFDGVSQLVEKKSHFLALPGIGLVIDLFEERSDRRLFQAEKRGLPRLQEMALPLLYEVDLVQHFFVEVLREGLGVVLL